MAENELENVDFHIKLADFGFSKKVTHLNDTSKTVCGTPLYMSPQMITKTSYTSKTDIWSLGIVFFELMTGKTPFYSSNKTQFEDKIQEGNYNFNLSEQVKESLTIEGLSFLNKCLQYDENKRAEI